MRALPLFGYVFELWKMGDRVSTGDDDKGPTDENDDGDEDCGRKPR
jgi:hypothetical protein